jgi:glutamate synthase (NADPH/NADH) small chain
MGKPTGFLEYGRTEARHRPIAQRIKDYKEFHGELDAQTLNTQAARCMDCGVPFCHAAYVVEGESIGCPLSNLIPEINDLVYRGRPAEAYERLRMTHPFPEFTGRVCPALCEGSCTLGEHEAPVTIKEIEFSLDTWVDRNGGIPPRIPITRTGKKVAVIGSGPSGLACADLLNQMGEQVTVFERANRPGGLLMYGIPNMKLDKGVVLKRIAVMEQEGINFTTGAEVGVTTPLQDLLNEFDALVLCGGATMHRPLTVPGAGLTGVVPAVRYLTHATRHLLDGTQPDDETLDAHDKDVIIVGGGDTGTDCIATAIRQGARSVVQFEINPQLPPTRRATNPWPLWPRVFKVDYGQNEAIELWGDDPREYSTTVKEVIGDSDGTVSAVKTVQLEWTFENGRKASREIEGSEKLRPAGLVLLAMGFQGPERTLIDALALETDARGNVKTPVGEYQTSTRAVFSAGDMRRGQSLVVWAIMEGRNAARQCHGFLNG